MHGREFGPNNEYCPEVFVDSDWLKEHVEANCLQPLSSTGSHNYSMDSKKYVTNSVIIFGELALFRGNRSMYQERHILLINAKQILSHYHNC